MKSTIGKLDVLSVFTAWALLIVFFVSLAYSKIFSESDASATHLVYLFGAFFCAAVSHFVLALFNRCPHCNKCLTVQGFKKSHPASSGSWDKVVWHWFSGSIVCIHCGQKVAKMAYNKTLKSQLAARVVGTKTQCGSAIFALCFCPLA